METKTANDLLTLADVLIRREMAVPGRSQLQLKMLAEARDMINQAIIALADYEEISRKEE